ncbi:MAG: hypothetical protein ACI3ZC_09700 [Candidatus Cryptobacteroides sp.]
MKMGKTPALDSEYIIDGAKMEFTPRQLLESASGQACTAGASGQIVDESIDPSPAVGDFDRETISAAKPGILAAKDLPRKIPLDCAGSISVSEAARAVVDTLWKGGHFRIGDLEANIEWSWNGEPTGSLAAFYSSVSEISGYLDMLGINIGGYSISGSSSANTVRFRMGVAAPAPEQAGESPAGMDEDLPLHLPSESQEPLYEVPFRTPDPIMSESRKCRETLEGNKNNWLIYIPFDTCSHRLGGSLLSELSGIPGGKAPDILDTDYFIDCYEVVREFVEDGIILSGVTVGAGGLMAALERMASGGHGIDADIESIMQSYKENDSVRILFSEIPGAVIEIPSSDFDYVDAELLLQDVAYYPIGHPGPEGVRVNRGSNNSISGILQSLMDVQAAEGED